VLPLPLFRKKKKGLRERKKGVRRKGEEVSKLYSVMREVASLHNYYLFPEKHLLRLSSGEMVLSYIA
jgi:hypothetical protein